MKILRLILGDQLSHEISSLKNAKKGDTILMCEVKEEATYVKHHKKKIAFIFSAMRHFCEELRNKEFNVIYENFGKFDNFSKAVFYHFEKGNFDKISVTFPGEYRVLEEIKSWQKKINVEICEDDRFLCSVNEFGDWAKSLKSPLMENFYRKMRKKHKILMNGDKPQEGKWNFDAQNRKKPDSSVKIPKHFIAQKDKITQEVCDLVEKNFSDHFGDIEPFYLATTRQEALKAFDDFIANRLKYFGDFQDAMLEENAFMFHSHIGFYLNIGILTPLECVKKVEKFYYEGDISINNAEGFIRQILGWREYIRGIYWLKMPNYKQENFFDAKRKLPDFFWGANTKMNCVKQSIKNTKENAYAHHIQRLMVIGNFCLLAQIDPQEVQKWYLLVYADAYEWVEMPNVVGMILFADGGYLATKPYCASGSYINKMSNYCKNCEFDVKEKNGKNACPFNYLYWNFLLKNKEKLKNNYRLNIAYKNLERFDDKKIEMIEKDSNLFLW